MDMSNDIREAAQVLPEAHLNDWLRNGDYDSLSSVVVTRKRSGEALSVFTDPVWDFTPYALHIAARKTHYQIRIPTYIAPLVHDELRYELMAAFYQWMHRPSSPQANKRISASTLCLRARRILSYVAPFILKEGYESITVLADSHVFTDFCTYLQSKNLASGTFGEVLSAVSCIQTVSRWMHYEFSLPSFQRNNLADKLGNQERKQRWQTAAIPKRIADALYAEAIELVETYWPYRELLTRVDKELQKAYEEGEKIVHLRIAEGKIKAKDAFTKNGSVYAHIAFKESSVSPEEIIQKNFGGNTVFAGIITYKDFTRLLTRLRFFTYICIGAFTGMRRSEIYEINRDSFYKTVFMGSSFFFVKSRLIKFVDGRPRHEQWVASPIVEPAIDLIFAITEVYREKILSIAEEESDSDISDQYKKQAQCPWLISYGRGDTPRVASNALSPSLSKPFMEQEHLKVTQEDLNESMMMNRGRPVDYVSVGDIWPLHSHQLRRTFTVFPIRHRTADFISVKQQLKHVVLQMTEWYGNNAQLAAYVDGVQDEELQQMLNEVNIDAIAMQYDSWYNSEQTLLGGKGEEIMIERLKDTTIYKNYDSTRKLVASGRLTLHGNGYMNCSAGYKCDMGGVMNSAFCTSCENSIIDEGKAENWRQKHLACCSQINQMVEGGHISYNRYSHYFTQIRAAERVMENFGIEFQIFASPVQILQ